MDHGEAEIRPLKAQLESLRADLRKSVASEGVEAVPNTMYRAVDTLLEVASSLIGECRRQTPYAALQPIITANGQFQWCCTHDPEHCVDRT